jgi:dihydrodipicolinate synthase/N-acetylneuraminate lyase
MHPRVTDAGGAIEERRQRALTRYYLAAGAGGLAVGVREARHPMDEPAERYRAELALAADEMNRHAAGRKEPLVPIAAVRGDTRHVVAEATAARELGYHAALIDVAEASWGGEEELIGHCRAVGEVLPIVGWCTPAAPGARPLPQSFWRRSAEIPNLVAINVGPRDRFRTIEVVRAVAEVGRDDVAFYTGNDDSAVVDLITPFQFDADGIQVERRFVGAMSASCSVWTHVAVELLKRCQAASKNVAVPDELLRLAVEVADASAAICDAANAFAGGTAGVREVLRRQGLLEDTGPDERLSPGQLEEIDRVCRAYPHLNDDAFVAEHLTQWLGA